MSSDHPLLKTAISAARAAGNIIVRFMDRLDRVGVHSKGANDFVSEVDHMAEEAIIGTIRRHYPEHAILAEESGSRGAHDYQWIIDPLDGTTNYLHGFPQFSVSIALRHRGILEQAVVYDPLRNELFTASRGRGAQLNDRRIRVSETLRLSESLLATGFPFRNLGNLDPWLASFRDLLIRTRGIRRAGSAALDLAWMAAGRCDGFWEGGLKIWDLAAGSLLIEEAGGLLGDFRGETGYLESGNVIAGNQHTYMSLLEVIRPHLGHTNWSDPARDPDADPIRTED
ncbi:MAG: inositol monophosphatase [Gammaproteobacteria bacterium]|nr:inositol monophosphatase [Gammaproteobacteria bacterium]